MFFGNAMVILRLYSISAILRAFYSRRGAVQGVMKRNLGAAWPQIQKTIHTADSQSDPNELLLVQDTNLKSGQLQGKLQNH